MRRAQLLPVACVCVLTLSIFCIADEISENRGVFNHVKTSRKIYDITHLIRPSLPVFDSKDGLGDDYIWLVLSIKNGSMSNNSEFKLSTHQGTHCDAPSHFYDEYYEQGRDVSTLSLQVLNGPALLVDVPRNSNITAKVMKSLNIPKGTERVLFRTLNTQRRLMWKTEFDSSFVGFTPDGAEYLVHHTDIKLVGIDYLSISAYDYAAPVHLTFLKNGRVTIVEGLNLDGVPKGKHNLHCLPMKMRRADGAPARCILIDDYVVEGKAYGR